MLSLWLEDTDHAKGFQTKRQSITATSTRSPICMTQE